MEGRVFLEKLDALGEKAKELKEAVKTAQKNLSRDQIDRVKYLVHGISYVVTNISQEFIGMNLGKTINNILLEAPINARDIFVKLGEVQLIPGEIVPHLKKLITMANTNTIDLNAVNQAIPSIEELIFYIKHFIEGVDVSEEEKEKVELIRKKKEKKKTK